MINQNSGMINPDRQRLDFAVDVTRQEPAANTGIFLLMQTIIPAQAEHAVWMSVAL